MFPVTSASPRRLPVLPADDRGYEKPLKAEEGREGEKENHFQHNRLKQPGSVSICSSSSSTGCFICSHIILELIQACWSRREEEERGRVMVLVLREVKRGNESIISSKGEKTLQKRKVSQGRRPAAHYLSMSEVQSIRLLFD